MKPKFHDWDDVTEYISTLQTQRDELVEALKPFTHPDLCKEFAGMFGDNPIIYVRGEAVIRIEDTRTARALLAKIAEEE